MKIDRKRFTILIGILLLSVLIAALILRGTKNNPVLPITDISLCDQDPRGLCVITFGSTLPDLMVINFQLPEEGYPVFQVKGMNRGMTYDYSCNVEEAVPTSVFCTGPRTPLGEYIEVEAYSVAENLLLARGKIFVSAVMVWTPSGIINTPSPDENLTATAAAGTTIPTETFTIPTQVFVTPILETAYPNPSLIIQTPVPGTAYPNP